MAILLNVSMAVYQFECLIRQFVGGQGIPLPQRFMEHPQIYFKAYIDCPQHDNLNLNLYLTTGMMLYRNILT